MTVIQDRSQFEIIGLLYFGITNDAHCGVNTLRPRQNGRHFTDDIFKCIFLNENVWIPIKISLKFVPKGPINNISSLVQKMVWRRPGAKPLSEPKMVSLLRHIWVTQPQWVKWQTIRGVTIHRCIAMHRYFVTTIRIDTANPVYRDPQKTIYTGILERA